VENRAVMVWLGTGNGPGEGLTGREQAVSAAIKNSTAILAIFLILFLLAKNWQRVVAVISTVAPIQE
jgi:hypothetical protein